MEHNLLELEKARMRMFFEKDISEDKEEDTYFDLKEMKEHLKSLPPDERKGVKDFERLRNLANGRNEHEGLHEIDRVIKELEEEERKKENQPEPEI